ncbi:hypothetical protein PENSPDRAFT_758496 [Peniophora sp. CONT]|nr:hypothetical protein PENSPDRAFT_758496 [Peniophora sp. CONT]
MQIVARSQTKRQAKIRVTCVCMDVGSLAWRGRILKLKTKQILRLVSLHPTLLLTNMSTFTGCFDSRLSLPPLDASAASPADSLDTPFPLTPVDPFTPSWAYPRIAIPLPVARIAKRSGEGHEEDEWPSDVPLHMVNVFRVFSTRVDVDSSTSACLKRKADDAFEDVGLTKKRRPDADHAVPFPAVGPLRMFEYQFQLADSTNASAVNGDILSELGIIDGPTAEELDASVANELLSAYTTFDYDLCSETDPSSSPSCTISDADHSFEQNRPPSPENESHPSISALPQLAVQQPQLYQHASVPHCDSSHLSASSENSHHASSDVYPEYTGVAVDVSACAMPTPYRIAPAQPSFLGEIPADVLTSSQPITRRISEHDARVPAFASEFYRSDQLLALDQQQTSAAYQSTQPYVDPRQVYWTPPPQAVYPQNDYAYHHGAPQDTRPMPPQQYSSRALYGSYPGGTSTSCSYTNSARDPAYENGSSLSAPFQTRVSPTAATLPLVDYQRAIIILDGRVLYACHLCACTFDLPNNLGLHLRWHRRKEESDIEERALAEEQAQRAYQAQLEAHSAHARPPLEQARPRITSTPGTLVYDGPVSLRGSHVHYSHHARNFAQSQFAPATMVDGSYAPVQAPQSQQQGNSFSGVARAAHREEFWAHTNTTYPVVGELDVMPPLPYSALAGAGWHTRRA